MVTLTLLGELGVLVYLTRLYLQKAELGTLVHSVCYLPLLIYLVTGSIFCAACDLGFAILAKIAKSYRLVTPSLEIKINTYTKVLWFTVLIDIPVNGGFFI